MENIKTGFKTVGSHKKNYSLLVAIVLIIFAVLGLYLFSNYHPAQSSQSSRRIKTLSQDAFGQQYGLRVNLIAVTAAGGMVDVRLKIIDGEKAKTILQDKGNFPALQVSNGKVVLNASDDAKSQEIKFVNGENLFLLYPNQGNAVKPGASITILFGNAALEPIEVK